MRWKLHQKVTFKISDQIRSVLNVTVKNTAQVIYLIQPLAFMIAIQDPNLI